jgi:hypothetical protein
VRGDEDEVLDTRVPGCLNKIAIAFQIHALGVVLTPRAAELAVVITVSTPSTAASNEARSRISPCTGCAPASMSSSAEVARPCWTSCEEGESRRTRIRTSLSCSSNRRVIMPPTIPVAPNTTIILVFLAFPHDFRPPAPYSRNFRRMQDFAGVLLKRHLRRKVRESSRRSPKTCCWNSSAQTSRKKGLPRNQRVNPLTQWADPCHRQRIR